MTDIARVTPEYDPFAIPASVFDEMFHPEDLHESIRTVAWWPDFATGKREADAIPGRLAFAMHQAAARTVQLIARGSAWEGERSIWPGRIDEVCVRVSPLVSDTVGAYLESDDGRGGIIIRPPSLPDTDDPDKAVFVVGPGCGGHNDPLYMAVDDFASSVAIHEMAHAVTRSSLHDARFLAAEAHLRYLAVFDAKQVAARGAGLALGFDGPVDLDASHPAARSLLAGSGRTLSQLAKQGDEIANALIAKMSPKTRLAMRVSGFLGRS